MLENCSLRDGWSPAQLREQQSVGISKLSLETPKAERAQLAPTNNDGFRFVGFRFVRSPTERWQNDRTVGGLPSPEKGF